jgi:hypothetical protein
MFYTVFIEIKRKVENKNPFLDRNELGCIEKKYRRKMTSPQKRRLWTT